MKAKQESIEHYNAIMIEEIRSAVRAELEGIHSRMDSFEHKLEAFRTEVNGRFNMVEAAIRCNADGIRELRSDMQQVTGRLDRVEDKIDLIVERTDDHETRLNQANL